MMDRSPGSERQSPGSGKKNADLDSFEKFMARCESAAGLDLTSPPRPVRGLAYPIPPDMSNVPLPGQLAASLHKEELKRAELRGSLTSLRKEMQDLLTMKRPPARLDPMKAREREELPALKLIKPLDPYNPPKEPRVRPCACGCGCLVRCDASEATVAPLEAKSVEVLGGPTKADPHEQRVACERLHRRNPRPAPVMEDCPRSKKGEVDLRRLELLAMPPEQYKEEMEKKRGPSVPRLDMAQVGAPPALPRGRSEPSLRKETGDTAPAPRPAPIRPPVYKMPKQPRQALKMDRSDLRDLPGLSSLLEAATAGQQSDSYVDLSSDWPSPRRPAAFRSATMQNKYVEERLYSKPAFKPGSIEFLQNKLDMLKAERKARALDPEQVTDAIS
eukprot:gnl/TRDRNA2_/TRDRNA2_179975_c0_seq1.p1 gnl/TRDRNA2_/TRDRNA2_179975_c0~~gnl/TRDRNA2_/TRDRNA2_179975_c0_seq1.p1  ORF type:complete len:388 (+),score=78.20 gnl/TRDRNA2_/TRDRNA2_179975_c0_seq1:90-1253(+)